MKLQDPSSDLVVYERNRRGDTFGFGVVFSDETLANIAAADPPSIEAIEAEFRYWSAMDVRRGEQSVTSDGHGFAALARVRLLDVLTTRALELGIDIRFEQNIEDLDAIEADLIVAGDGVNSGVRSALEEFIQPTIKRGPAKYIWTGTTAPFDRFTFLFEETEHGWVQAHVYPFNETTSTFIVEMAASTWEAAGLAGHDGELSIGESDQHAIEWCESVFAAHLGEHGLIGNNSRWLSFPRISCARWSHGNVVLLGDAIHTAHYSIGSGTKLALEDAIELSEALRESGDIAQGLKLFEERRRPEVESLQRAAATSEEWFQQVDHHAQLPFEQFAFSLFTRSQRVTYDNLMERDPGYVEGVRDWYFDQTRTENRPANSKTPPIFYPFTLRELRLGNRIVVSPMAQYSAVDGMPSDWHLVHLGSRAVGGAAMVMTEMSAVSAEGRITPGCPGIYTDQQAEAWERITRFAHEHTEAKMGLQIGHSGRKGATKVPWEEIDAPLDSGGWPIVSASPIPYRPDSVVPAELSVEAMDGVVDDFVQSARRGADAGFDLLEVHLAHGYLLSAFLSSATNHRTDEFGGSLDNRARFPLRVVREVRAAWPDAKPLSVRISATDWLPDGFGRDDAVALSAMLVDAGVDIIDVSTGQVDLAEAPAFGRLYQTPFSEVIRNSLGVPTMAVGAISSIDDVNTVLMAGRADLCMIARAHLVDPYWTLNAAIDLGQSDQPWPKQYWSGRTSRRREQSAVALVDRDLR